jgi:signal peptidase I
MGGFGLWNKTQLEQSEAKPRTPWQRVNRALSMLATGIVALGLIGVIAFFVGPRLLGWQMVVVLSGSMEPALPVGSVIFVEPASAESVKVGDILTFRPGSDVVLPADGKVVQVTHRVVEVIRKDGQLSFRVKGDANQAPDGYLVPARDVVGTVKGDIPYLGLAADRLRTKEGFALLIGIPGALIIAGEIRKIVREIRSIRSAKRATREAAS